MDAPQTRRDSTRSTPLRNLITVGSCQLIRLRLTPTAQTIKASLNTGDRKPEDNGGESSAVSEDLFADMCQTVWECDVVSDTVPPC